MKMGIIGVGVMGEPMARNLHTAGFAVTVYNRTASRCAPLREAGLTVAATAQDVIDACDAIILMLPGHEEIDQVLGRDAQGKITAAVAGKTLIVMATVSPAYSTTLGNAIKAAGSRYIEAPVSGSRKPAETGQLVILASAEDDSHIDAVQPAFDALGKKTVRCGAVPTAMRMKLANNLLLIASFEALSEAAHFAQRIGLDMPLFFEMVQAGPLANDVVRMKVPKLLADDFAEQAPIRHVSKDIGLVCAEAQRCETWLPIAQANRELFGRAIRRGLASDDAIGIIKVLREGVDA
ncbi:dehydrogenase [Bordetella ansorpii]|uniref:Dehydrogenase n=1 Tax=Bordetella ansorpii TaxID=288768 RepID=A0A157SEV5_9BORD|nr:NAD(P)-dependent oxidoreductase [Bordetella ansorpii]SAI68909.1 dehydrogenase [Bordetella ansorpii]